MSGLFDVSKEIILVTAASQGLGRQFARVLFAHGAAVALEMDVTDSASIGKAIEGADSTAPKPISTAPSCCWRPAPRAT